MPGVKYYFCASCWSTVQSNKNPNLPGVCNQCGDPLCNSVSGSWNTIWLCSYHEALYFGNRPIYPPRSQCQICMTWKDAVHMHSSIECNDCIHRQMHQNVNMNFNSNYGSAWNQKYGWMGVDMASNRTIEFSNGDTEEWTRLDIGFTSKDEERKIISGLIKISLDSSSQIYDFKRRCWFIKTDVVAALRKGFETLINQGNLRGWTIKDSRVIVESFEDFFESEAQLEAKARTKEDIVRDFLSILSANKIMYTYVTTTTINEMKSWYRKAALILHPDRNNGDSSRMTELNLIWAELQSYFK